MARLVDQCPEVLHSILTQVESTDLGSVSKTCRFLNDFIGSDVLLWKTHYLRQFDYPSNQSTDLSWQDRVRCMVAMQKLLMSESDEVKRTDETLEQVCTKIFDLMVNSTSNPTKNTAFLSEMFQSESNVSSFLCRSSLFQHARLETDVPASSPELRQLSAKLHVFYGLEVEVQSESICTTSDSRVHPYARSRVYDLRRHTEQNLWGPFMDDGSCRTDWEKVQAIMIDLSYNLRQYTERRPSGGGGVGGSRSSGGGGHLWDEPFHGIAPNSYVSHPLHGTLAPPADPELDLQDPYGVTGTWMRIVCFLDYNDLYAFNFESDPIPTSQEREPIGTREAFRLIRLQLRVTEVAAPGEDDHPDFPVVHFTGSSKSTYMAWDPNANSKIKGTVRTTRSGAIRWTSFSIFHGEERWRSEGVQIGGLRSARGILGNWFDKDYDAHGPAGPTAFWKISDDMVEDKKQPYYPHQLSMPWQQIVNVVFD